MIESVSQIQVRYAETDMMGIVYHANYLPWLEIGRTDLLRNHGLPYSELEEKGYLLPVLEIACKYRKPARYDDLIDIHTTIEEKPLLKIKLNYEVKRNGELLATGSTIHAFMNRVGQPLRPPAFFLEKLAPYFR